MRTLDAGLSVGAMHTYSVSFGLRRANAHQSTGNPYRITHSQRSPPPVAQFISASVLRTWAPIFFLLALNLGYVFRRNLAGVTNARPRKIRGGVQR